MELSARDVPHSREVALPIFYKGRQLSTSYRVDLLCYGCVIVELKALGKLSGTEEAQILNYLKASRHEIGLLLNFGARSLECKRYIFTPKFNGRMVISPAAASSRVESVKSAQSAESELSTDYTDCTD